MSDALNYLVAARPDAIVPYFKFLKEAGKSLDVRTRDLISVITKVDAQTEAGFRQYLSRALRNGASANEVLDALLMAFPALGLAKIVWAVDIILEMDIPKFKPEAMAYVGEWHDVMPAAQVKAGEIQRVDCDERSLFVYRDAKGISVYDSRCPHQSTDIPQLALNGTTLTCPKHEWAFDVHSGKCIRKGNSPLRRWESRTVEGRLMALW